MMNVIVDTNIFVSSLISPRGHPAAIIDLIKNRKFIIFYSEPILYEYWEVLLRKKFSFNPFLVTQLIHSIVRFGIQVENNECDIKTSDEDDQIFLNATIETIKKYGLAYLITGNINDYPKKSFIVTPAYFMKIYSMKPLNT